MSRTPSPPVESSSGSALRRDLKVTDTAAFSIGLIGPVGAMALLGVGAAGLLGRGATWAFVFAILGVCLVAYGFVKLSRHITHTGSVFALVGRTIGPRTGFVAGCLLFMAYVTIGTGSTIEIALFSNRVLSGVHLAAGVTEWYWTALVALAVTVLLSFSETRVITRTLLACELGGAVLVGLLSIVVLIRTGVGHAPGHARLSWAFLELPHGTGAGTIAAAAVFGFLAFAGFEGAATLGEETVDPKRQIPRAIKITVVVVGTFFLLTIVGQSIGYGTDAAGAHAFAAADSPYSDLAQRYVGTPMAVLLELVASLSVFAITLGTVGAAARVGLALVRSTGCSGPVTRLTRRGAPIGTVGVATLLIAVFVTAQRLAGTGALAATFLWLGLGSLALLVAYGLATIGALRYLFFSGRPKAPRWQVIIPVLATAFVCYTIYSNVADAEGVSGLFPWIILAVTVVTAGVALGVPGLAARVRRQIGAAPPASASLLEDPASGKVKVSP
ncbi:APC family permease [Streptomyces sp. NPDC051320]|uniref:APC family permease n=1 Tax=Streptomyces sp. NPDC051320 TaxID=3154644 RepID=UPI00341E6838